MAAKSIKKNYVLNLLYQILALLTPFITTPYISRVLGADGIGTVSYVESIVSYFVLFAAMGITTHGQREISYVQGSKEQRSIVFWNTKILGFCTAGMAVVVYIIFAVNQPDISLYFIYVLNILAIAVDVTWFFQGLEEFGRIIFRNVIFKFVNIIYVFAVIHSTADLKLYAFGHAFFNFLSSASLWSMLPKYTQKVKLQTLHPFKDIKVVLSLFLPTIAIQVYTVLDKTMIGIITQDAFENGYYEQALKITKMVLILVTALGTVMIPRIGFFFEKKDQDEIRRLMYRGYRFVWFLGTPLCFGLLLVSSNFVPWFFGEGYSKVSSLVGILAFLILAIGINNVTGMQYLIPTRRQSVFTVTVVIGACVNFMLNMLLIPQFQSTGAAIASVVAEATIAIVQLYIVRKELSPIRVLKEGIPYFIAGTVMMVVLYFLRNMFIPAVMNTIILVCVGAVVYFAVLIMLRDEFFLSNVRMILDKIRKR